MLDEVKRMPDTGNFFSSKDDVYCLINRLGRNYSTGDGLDSAHQSMREILTTINSLIAFQQSNDTNANHHKEEKADTPYYIYWENMVGQFRARYEDIHLLENKLAHLESSLTSQILLTQTAVFFLQKQISTRRIP